MGLYIKYTRIAAPFNSEELQKKFDEITAEGLEIIHYEERKQETDRFYVTMVLGRINEGNKEILKG